METILSSKTKTVIIGPDRPFTIIGERINPTGRKLLAKEMAAGDFSRVEKDALAQVAAGAHMLDVNAGIPKEDVIIDPLIMPIGAIQTSGQQVFALLRKIRKELGVNTTGGASNISFGLPNRPTINAHFLSMAIAYGLTSTITNPCELEIRKAIYAADLLVGHDENCLTWIGANRDVAKSGNGSSRQSTRRKRRPCSKVVG